MSNSSKKEKKKKKEIGDVLDKIDILAEELSKKYDCTIVIGVRNIVASGHLIRGNDYDAVNLLLNMFEMYINNLADTVPSASKIKEAYDVFLNQIK